MPDVDSTLRQIACWRYIIVSDLSQSFYQIPLSNNSLKYCGVATPFKGVRVYTRCAMGMPGSETALEELMCRVLGDLLHNGCVAKIADDLYCGGNSPSELLANWRQVLVALDKCDLRPSAKKTIIAPVSTTILGWIWSAGSIHASPHRIAALASCPPPKTVRGLRAFIGSYKMLSRVIEGFAALLDPLERITAGNQSNSLVVWSETLLTSLKTAKRSRPAKPAGSANLPSDFASRNAPPCDDPRCQICSFVSQAEDSVVRPISVQDVLSGSVALPFTTQSAWLHTQQECPDLRRVHSHLKQGTRPSKKSTNVKDIKRYLNVASISNDGLVVVKKDEPFCPSRECIVIPRSIIDGLLTALHIKLNYTSRHQLKQVVLCYFYALDLDQALDQCSQTCHTCASLKKIPSYLTQQSTSDPPAAVGTSFAADVLKRNKQLILAFRETVSSFTTSCIIEDERRDTLRAALIRLCLELHPISGPCAVVRVDPAPGFAALANDEELRRHKITIEVGRVKNANKNPVAEKCIAELGDELLRISPEGESISAVNLAIATANLNSRIRDRGLSAREMWYKRDQFTNRQLPISDLNLIELQHSNRLHNHAASAKSKTPRAQPPTVSTSATLFKLPRTVPNIAHAIVTWLPPSMVHGATYVNLLVPYFDPHLTASAV